jgi:hypothetical protein
LSKRKIPHFPTGKVRERGSARGQKGGIAEMEDLEIDDLEIEDLEIENNFILKISEYRKVKPVFVINGYCIGVVDTNIYTRESVTYIQNNYIAFIMRITIKDYTNILFNQYNATLKQFKFIFRTMEECFRACEWVQSMLIMEALKSEGGK